MVDVIRQIIKKELHALNYFAIGEIVKLDFTNYQAQVRILTSRMKTNWLRISTSYCGNNFGSVKSLNIGDEVLVCFPDGNPGSQGIIIARLYGKDLPPRITDDEVRFLHKSGTDILIKQDGSVEGKIVKKASLEISDETTITCSKKVNINGSPTVNLNGESYAAVIYEQLETIINGLITQLNSHMHTGNMGAPCPNMVPFQLQLTPAKSTKVKLGG